VDHAPYRTRIAISLFLILVGAAAAQVEVSLPANLFKSEDKIDARVVKKGKLSVSYCVEMGQGSPHAGTIESTPIPFQVERKNEDKWSVLLIGPDVGSSQHSVTLSPGASSEFPFRLNNIGEMRLVLDYWIGERDDVCEGTKKGRKTARSNPFSIIKN